jgi:hypothetical protein
LGSAFEKRPITTSSKKATKPRNRSDMRRGLREISL